MVASRLNLADRRRCEMVEQRIHTRLYYRLRECVVVLYYAAFNWLYCFIYCSLYFYFIICSSYCSLMDAGTGSGSVQGGNSNASSKDRPNHDEVNSQLIWLSIILNDFFYKFTYKHRPRYYYYCYYSLILSFFSYLIYFNKFFFFGCSTWLTFHQPSIHPSIDWTLDMWRFAWH